MLIRLKNKERGCECGSDLFHHRGYDCDGGCQTWIIAQCAKCRKEYELWEPIEYDRVMTEEEKLSIVINNVNLFVTELAHGDIYLAGNLSTDKLIRLIMENSKHE